MDMLIEKYQTIAEEMNVQRQNDPIVDDVGDDSRKMIKFEVLV